MPVLSNQITAQAQGHRYSLSQPAPSPGTALPKPDFKPAAAKNLLHHARYYKKQVELKEVRDLKKQALLRKARNSKFFKVTAMNDLKSFDKHV